MIHKCLSLLLVSVADVNAVRESHRAHSELM